MKRRSIVKGLAAASGLGLAPFSASIFANANQPISVEQLPKLEGKLTLYLGRGEGGLYENVIEAIRERNPKFELAIRRGPTAALANAIVAEAKAGVRRADLFWAVDSGSVGMVSEAGLATPLASDITAQLQESFRYPSWAPISGRIRTLPYNPSRIQADKIPTKIQDLADSKYKIGWAPAYAAFQSFITAMRLLEGEKRTADWLKAIKSRSVKFAGELGVVMAVERGEVDFGFANHYYTLRLKAGKPDANVALAFTQNDAGCLVNASGVVALNDKPLAQNFIRYLLTEQVQSYLAREAYEVPLVAGIDPPQGLPPLDTISPPKVDLTQLADMRPTLRLLRNAGVL